MGRTPHKCPTCKGYKRVEGVPCTTCSATGVVWDGPVEEAVEAPDDHRDLTFTPEVPR